MVEILGSHRVESAHLPVVCSEGFVAMGDQVLLCLVKIKQSLARVVVVSLLDVLRCGLVE